METLLTETESSSATKTVFPVDIAVQLKVDSTPQLSESSVTVKVQHPKHCVQIEDIFQKKPPKTQTVPSNKHRYLMAPSSQKLKRKTKKINSYDEEYFPEYDYEEEQDINKEKEPEVSPNTASIKVLSCIIYRITFFLMYGAYGEKARLFFYDFAPTNIL